MTMLPKAIYRISVITAKTYTKFFIETAKKKKKSHPKTNTGVQKTLYCPSNPEQREQCWSDLSDFKLGTETKQMCEAMEQNSKRKHECT